jgi:hypothetical protein
MILPDDYLKAVADAAHEVGGLFVLDCIASGAMWVDMEATGVDVLVSAPQKGWSSSPCCAMVMLSERARAAIDATTSTSFACDLKKWLQIMETYEGGGHAYHATMPTDALTRLREVMKETQAYGFDRVRAEQIDLGAKVRALFESRGIPSVAADGFKAPGVVVSYTTDPEIHNSKKFLAEGPADRCRRAPAVRRTGRLHDLPRRPVRPGKVAPRGSHRGPSGRRTGPARYRARGKGRGRGLNRFVPIWASFAGPFFIQEAFVSISMYSASVPVFSALLDNLDHFLDKGLADAEARKYDPIVLAQSRLAPDMLPLARQVLIACDAAKLCAARLAGLEAPTFDDTETTLPELKARIRKTLDFLATVTPDQIDGTEDKDITYPVGREGTRTMKGEAYLKHWATANVYFHVTTAYAILRHNGVRLGKVDFLLGSAAP